MLYESAAEDAVLIDVLMHITRAETEAAMESGFKELNRYAEHRMIDFEKAVAKARKDAGLVRITGDEELAAAADEWAQIAGGGAVESPGPDGGAE